MGDYMKVVIEIDLPDGQAIPTESDIKRLTSPDWLASWWHIDDVKGLNKKLTKQVVNTQTGQYLHRFQWLEDEVVGELPTTWNWLTDWYNEPMDGTPQALHFTAGGPWHANYSNCKYNDVWRYWHQQVELQTTALQ
jgi:hypothetical protein